MKLIISLLLIIGLLGYMVGYLIHKSHDQRQAIAVLQEEIDTLQGE